MFTIFNGGTLYSMQRKVIRYIALTVFLLSVVNKSLFNVQQWGDILNLIGIPVYIVFVFSELNHRNDPVKLNEKNSIFIPKKPKEK